jgi:hypothetical protein
MLAGLAVSAVCLFGSAQAATITYVLAGTFDVSVGGNEYDDLDVTLTGIGDTGAVFFPLGADTPAIVLSSLTASVSGYGIVPLENMTSFFSNNSTGIAGFNDMANGDFATFTGLSSYDARSNLAPTAVTLSFGGLVASPLGDATILSASDLTFSAVVAGVPEPAEWAMMLAGLAGMGWMVRAGVRRDARPIGA